MPDVKIPDHLLEGVLYALDQIQYSGEWYEFARCWRRDGQPDPQLPNDFPDFQIKASDGMVTTRPNHLLKLKQIREAEALILRRINATPVSGFIYLIGQADAEDHATIASVKVGFSKDPWRRLKQLETASPTPLYIVGRLGDQSLERERELHQILHPHRANREWFRWSPTVKAILAEAGFKFEWPVAA